MRVHVIMYTHAQDCPFYNILRDKGIFAHCSQTLDLWKDTQRYKYLMATISFPKIVKCSEFKYLNTY